MQCPSEEDFADAQFAEGFEESTLAGIEELADSADKILGKLQKLDQLFSLVVSVLNCLGQLKELFQSHTPPQPQLTHQDISCSTEMESAPTLPSGSQI